MQYYNHLTSIFSHCVTPWFTEWLNQLIYLQGLLMVCFSHTAITISSSCQHISRLHSHSTFTRVQHQRPPAADFPLASTHTREAPPTQHTIPDHMDSSHPHSDTRLRLLGTLSPPTRTVPTHTMTSTGDLTVNRKNAVMPMVLLILQCCTWLHKGHWPWYFYSQHNKMLADVQNTFVVSHKQHSFNGLFSRQPWQGCWGR